MPAARPGWKYPRYEPWLKDAFFDGVCSYCLLRNGKPTIDHVKPQSYAPDHVDEPSNLLFACTSCNRAKADYHPEHQARRRLPNDCTGYAALDVRVDDLAALFTVHPDGSLETKKTERQAFAAWNATTLLALDLPTAVRERQELMTLVALLNECMSRKIDEPGLAKHAEVLVGQLARRWPFIAGYGIDIAAETTAQVLERRNELMASAEHNR
jgi:HNH endonuclease